MFLIKYHREDVLKLVPSILNDRADPSPINKTLIALIPKVKKPSQASESRPISLCTVMFKLVTKTIADHLMEILSENQSAFLPGPQITGNALLAFECFNYMKKKTKKQEGLYGD